jgi:succinate-semialdehyde dehydrogenase/glutarate-semialdehyde dehydrogenase
MDNRPVRLTSAPGEGEDMATLEHARPAQTQAVLAHLEIRHLIGGRWRESSGATRQVVDPGTGEPFAEVAWGGEAEIRDAIDAASSAQRDWASRTAYERGDILARGAVAIRSDLDDLATIMTLESGKPLAEARVEWTASSDVFRWFAEEGKRAYGRVVPAAKEGRRIIVLVQPAGVAGTITAWNFPAYLPARKWAAALAAGCTVVARPSSKTPLCALALARTLQEAGLPDGVLNVVLGPAAPIADAMLADKRVRVIGFTGSESVGRYLVDRASETFTRVSLEMGGSAPVLVLEDADLERAVKQSIQAKFRNAGQVCISPSRFLVQSTVLDRFTELAAAAVEGLSVGHGLEPASNVGPLIDAAAVAKVADFIDDALLHGGQLIRGGHPVPRPGFFFEPTIVTGVRPPMKLATEEVFGPVMAISPFETVDEGIELANATRFGLAAYLHTRDLHNAFRVGEALEYGIVGVNDMLPATAEAPFGGWKSSGNASEGGIEGLGEYLETKYMAIGG